MTIKETRPYPVPAEVVMRSTLFVLANMQARLQVYNEQTGVIVATISKWMGLQKQDVIVKVRRNEQTAILDLEAPDPEKAKQLLDLIASYITDGAGRVQADATIQWIDIQKDRANRARRSQLVGRAKGLLPGQSAPEAAEESALAIVDEQGNQLIQPDATDAALMPVPDNPGVLVKNQQDMVIELKVDPDVFTDRTSYLSVCEACAATVMRGSKYCPSCGRPLTLEAVQPELQGGAATAASASLTAGLIAFGAALAVPFVLLILPELLVGNPDLSFLENVGQSVTPVRLVLAGLLGVLPGLVFGWRAIARAQQASFYQNLKATFDSKGRRRAVTGNVLGWVAIYLCIAWILFIGVAYLFR